MQSNTNLFTLGHSIYKVDRFIKILNDFKITTIVDVRSIPYSKFASDYNKENIQNFIIKQGLSYIYMGDLLGGKGILDIKKRWQNKDFLQGIQRLKNGISKNYKIALMCGEKDPKTCHRFHLIGEYLATQNIDILHIVPSKNGYSNISHTKNKQDTLL